MFAKKSIISVLQECDLCSRQIIAMVLTRRIQNLFDRISDAGGPGFKTSSTQPFTKQRSIKLGIPGDLSALPPKTSRTWILRKCSFYVRVRKGGGGGGGGVLVLVTLSKIDFTVFTAESEKVLVSKNLEFMSFHQCFISSRDQINLIQNV